MKSLKEKRSCLFKKGIAMLSALCLLVLFSSNTMVASAMGHREVKGYAKVANTLNVREDPLLDANIIEQLKPGEIVTVISTDNERWTEILTNTGYTGFVSNEYFRVSDIDSEEYELQGVAVITKTDGSSENRNFNMAKAAEKIDGLILQPDEEFAWYSTDKTEGVVGPASKENGYKEAPIIVAKKSTMGYGGGVCQVSTALYNAINKIGIEPTELHHHSLQSSYVEEGMDATVSYPGKNFVFTNTKDYAIYFKAYTDGPQVVVEVYKALY